MAATKSYHINPETGNPNLCRAEKGKCPFGSPEEHFPTKGEALLAYENRMALKDEHNKPLRKGGVKVDLLRNSSHETGYQARKYLLLWNHPEPELLTRYRGKVQEKEY